MTEFGSTLSAALYREAKEIAMSADMHQAERRLEQAIRSADRQRRIWIVVAAAAAVVVVVAGVVLGTNRLSTPQPAKPTPSPTHHAQAGAPFPVDASLLTPALTAQLPHWVAFAERVGVDWGFYEYGQTDCPETGCPADKQLEIGLYTVKYMWPLQAGSTLTQHPGYPAYVNAWKSVATLGYGTVTDVATTSVGGKPATTMTIANTKHFQGLAYCNAPTDARSDCWGTEAGRTIRLAIVDQGTGKPPTMLYESWNSDNPDGQSVAAEFATWLRSVHFE